MGTIKVTLQEIANAANAMGELNRDKMSGKLALRIARLSQALDKELDPLNEVTRMVFNKYAEVPEPKFDDGGKRINSEEPEVPKKSEGQFNAEIKEVLSEEVEISGPWLMESDIEKLDNVRAGIVYQLLPFIEESPEN